MINKYNSILVSPNTKIKGVLEKINQAPHNHLPSGIALIVNDSNSLLGIRLGCGVFILQFVVILFFGYDEGSEDSVELDSEPQLTDSIVKTKETKFCTGCGSNRKPSANFCGNCGQDF